MRDLLIGVALAWLTVGAVSPPLPVAGEARGHVGASEAVWTSGLSSSSGLAILRVGSPSPPDLGKPAFAVLADAALPRPTIISEPAAAVGSSPVSLLELTRPQRGPPAADRPTR